MPPSWIFTPSGYGAIPRAYRAFAFFLCIFPHSPPSPPPFPSGLPARWCLTFVDPLYGAPRMTSSRFSDSQWGATGPVGGGAVGHPASLPRICRRGPPGGPGGRAPMGVVSARSARRVLRGSQPRGGTRARAARRRSPPPRGGGRTRAAADGTAAVRQQDAANSPSPPPPTPRRRPCRRRRRRPLTAAAPPNSGRVAAAAAKQPPRASGGARARAARRRSPRPPPPRR
ncbi:hypothetical protein BU14_0207s0021 [Porphyra umbilicalis]|uniref:Uncharacterized protein n=1 Tax=Porphyra umbilicalis TaxID=2786 RepID=A0A1X6P5F1_PORUM|nr:hypothetical protein BU14_0207s0021 [Porphyra umbilicalis]|eukprot:OSX76102.1 hypothetical protein BU14_0207s0021 [Porphyra umbilicalis]